MLSQLQTTCDTHGPIQTLSVVYRMKWIQQYTLNTSSRAYDRSVERRLQKSDLMQSSKTFHSDHMLWVYRVHYWWLISRRSSPRLTQHTSLLRWTSGYTIHATQCKHSTLTLNSLDDRQDKLSRSFFPKCMQTGLLSLSPPSAPSYHFCCVPAQLFLVKPHAPIVWIKYKICQ